MVLIAVPEKKQIYIQNQLKPFKKRQISIFIKYVELFIRSRRIIVKIAIPIISKVRFGLKDNKKTFV